MRKGFKMKTHINFSFIFLSLFMSLGSSSLVAQDLSAYEVVDNLSVGLTVAPFEKSGLCLVDIDNNGWVDVYTPRYKAPGFSRLFVNNSGFFTDITHQTPLQQIEGQGQEFRTFTIVWADYDNDGDKDCSFGTDKELHLLRNDNNVFTEVSEEMGFVGQVPPGFIMEWYYNLGGWADYDLDGDLDCVVFQQNNRNLYLFRNDGDHFTNAATEANLDSTKLSLETFVDHVSWTDFDLDGDPDLFGKYAFYENRNGKFYDITDSLGFVLGEVDNREFFDYDNDGDLDYFKATPSAEGSDYDELWENKEGQFVNVSADVGMELLQYSHRGLAIGDFDNDGDQDIFLENSNSDDSYDILLLNEEIAPGERVFDDVAEFIGITKTGDRKGCGFFDYDKDGFLDIYLPSAEHNHILYHNAAVNETNWIGFILEGTISNRGAIGSIVRLYYVGKQQLRYTKCGNGWVRQDNPWVHFGLGFETSVDSVVIQWPLGYKQILTGIEINQYHDIKEPDYSAIKSRNIVGTKLTEFRLGQNYPNPFNSLTKINYVLQNGSVIKLAIYDLTGRKIVTLINQKKGTGYHFATWDGCNQFGKPVSSGVYIVRLNVDETSQSRKLTFIK
jgi:hypothetical protein